MKKYDLIIVGAGLAGLRAAIEAVKYDLHVAVISKVHPLRSSSVTASGGLNAAMPRRSSPDSTDLHYEDTMECGHNTSEHEALNTFVKAAPHKIKELEKWGCLFSREKDSSIAVRKMGASTYPRTIYSSDKTGHVVMSTLYEQCIRLRQNRPDKLRFYNEWFVQRLLVNNNSVAGVVALDIATGKMEVFSSKAVIWASGGVGRVYGSTSNALINSGWGMAVPMHAGAALRDMEYIQFHPTQLHGSHILITEAARGEGGLLLNLKEERFLSAYKDTSERMELSPRDAISRNIKREILAGRGVNASCVHLDLRSLGSKKLKKQLPGVRELCKTFAGLDPIRHKIPVTPGQHFTIGGIATNEKAETAINGFFAAGECACNGMHGSNRMGGNSLMETLVFGEISALSAVSHIKHKYIKVPNKEFFKNVYKEEESKLKEILSSNGEHRVVDLREKMQSVMDEHVGIYRDGMGLVEAAQIIKELKTKYKTDLLIDGINARANYGLIEALELKGSLDIADVIVQAASKRKESIGVHFRNDFPTSKGRPRYSLTKLKKNRLQIRYFPVKIKTSPINALLNESGLLKP